MNEREDNKYWDARAIEFQDRPLKMVMDDVRTEDHQEIIKKLFVPFQSAKVLDVACGHGRFSEMFTFDYVGIDHSEEMINLAKKWHPNRSFVFTDGRERPFGDDYDLIFQVISLSSLGMTHEQFKDLYFPMLRKGGVLMSLEFEEFRIYPKL